MAFTKKEKTEMLEQYGKWITDSQAVFLVEYKGMKMKDIDTVRDRIRDTGSEMHIVKNTLLEIALDRVGIHQPKELLEGSTAITFAVSDPPALAKILEDVARRSEFFKVKGGMLGKHTITSSDVKALAELPPLAVLQAKLLGTIMAPASRLARTLAEPGRSIAAVVKAYSEKENAPAEVAG